jgi:hypothetical protein
LKGERRDSNPRPPGPQPGALPTELRPPRRAGGRSAGDARNLAVVPGRPGRSAPQDDPAVQALRRPSRSSTSASKTAFDSPRAARCPGIAVDASSSRDGASDPRTVPRATVSGAPRGPQAEAVRVRRGGCEASARREGLRACASERKSAARDASQAGAPVEGDGLAQQALQPAGLTSPTNWTTAEVSSRSRARFPASASRRGSSFAAGSITSRMSSRRSARARLSRSSALPAASTSVNSFIAGDHARAGASERRPPIGAVRHDAQARAMARTRGLRHPPACHRPRGRRAARSVRPATGLNAGS